MKKILYTLIIGLTLMSCGQKNDKSKAPLPGPAPKINIEDAKTFTLDNGLKVILMEDHKLPLVEIQLSLDIDPILEKEKKGYIELTGQMLKAGTKNRSKAEIDEAIDFLGATIYTASTSIGGNVLKKHLHEYLPIFQEILLEPAFSKNEFRKLLLLNETSIKANETSQEKIASNLANCFNFGKDHPYGEITTPESLKKINIQDCINYYNTYFKPNVSYLVMVGDLTLDEAKEISQQYFGDWRRGEVPTHSYHSIDGPEKNQVIVSNKDAATQSYLFVTFPIDYHLNSEDFMALQLTNAVLGYGGGFSGRLLQNLREKHAWTYGAFSFMNNDEIKGTFYAYAQVTSEATDSAVIEIKHEMDRLKNELVDNEDLQLLKNSISGNFARSLENASTIARFSRNIQKYNLPLDYYKTYLERLNSVTPEEIMAAAKKHFNTDRMNIIAVGDKDLLLESMAHLTPDNKIMLVDINGNEIKQTKQEIPASVTAKSVVENYIKAIGGKEKIASIKDIKITQNMAIQGMVIGQEMMIKGEDKKLNQQLMGGQVISKMVVNGDKVIAPDPATGQPMKIEGEHAELIKNQITIVPELDYLTKGYDLKLLGMETVNGKDTYKVQVIDNHQNKKVDFFYVKGGLKAKSVANEGGQSMSLLYKEFMEQSGFKYPKVIELSMGGQIITMTTTDIQINKGLDDSLFE